MPQRRSSTSTLLVVLLALAVLAALAGFSLLDRLADDDNGEPGSSTGGLPAGFSRLPDDLFFERIYGAQRLAGSWAIHQEVTRAGQLRTAFDAVSEIADGSLDVDATVQFLDLDTQQLESLEVRVVGGVYFVKGFPSKRPWWKVDPTEGARELGTAQGIDRLISQSTNAREIQPLVETVTLVGPDNVDGVATAHYRLELKEAREVIGSSAPEDARPIIDVWVDADERPVRVTITVTAGQDSVVTTSDYSRYGDDFTITAPPAGQSTTTPPEVDDVEQPGD